MPCVGHYLLFTSVMLTLVNLGLEFDFTLPLDRFMSLVANAIKMSRECVSALCASGDAKLILPCVQFDFFRTQQLKTFVREILMLFCCY
jgi:hypothetical protein